MNTEAVAQRCSVKKVFLEILQNPQEKSLCGLFFAQFLKTPFLTALASVTASLNSQYKAKTMHFYFNKQHLL